MSEAISGSRLILLPVAAAIGLALDWLLGNPVAPAIVAAVIAAPLAASMAWALAYALGVNVAWLTVAYTCVSLREGASEMAKLAADIAGLSIEVAYALVYVIIVLLSLASGAAAYLIKSTLGG